MTNQTRHLHHSGDTHTLCGRGLTQCNSVHVTKARKTDCKECRATFRATRNRPTGPAP